jgi:hypothetical protein
MNSELQSDTDVSVLCKWLPLSSHLERSESLENAS